MPPHCASNQQDGTIQTTQRGDDGRYCQEYEEYDESGEPECNIHTNC